MNPLCPGASTGGTSLLGGGTATTYPTPTTPSATLTLPATAGTVGAIGTFTASAGVFFNTHTLGEISGGSVAGRATIIAVTNSTSVSAQITQAFPTSPTTLTSWQLRESVFGTVFSLLPPSQVHLLAYSPRGTNSASNTEWLDTFVSLTPSTSGPAALSVADSLDRTINPNRLARSGKKATLQGLVGNRVLTDGSRQAVIYHYPNSHNAGLLMIYLPKEKILIEADSYNPPANAGDQPGGLPFMVQFYDYVQRLGLEVEQVIPIHGRLLMFDEIRRAVEVYGKDQLWAK